MTIIEMDLNAIVLTMIYIHVKFEGLIINSFQAMDLYAKFALDLETGNVEGQDHREGSQ